ncbi:hypothetical protein PTKIN_Ptkin16aG0090200 [Pterospermum kingtungense]
MVSHKPKSKPSFKDTRIYLCPILKSTICQNSNSFKVEEFRGLSFLDNHIIPNFNYFKDLTGCDDNDVIVAYKRYPGVFQNNFPSFITPNLSLLREYGVLESNILSKLVDHPRVFAASHEKFKRTLEEVKKLGFNPLRQNFLSALKALVQMSKSTWDGKVNVFKERDNLRMEWGWSDEEIALAFWKLPFCMMLSKCKITAAVSFYVSTLGCKPSYIANRQVLLGLSLNKRLIPRWSLFQVLLSRGLIEKEISVRELFESREKDFLESFVTPYEDPQLLELYKQEAESFKIDGKTKQN